MRIMYWNNSCLEPEIEAVSKEVFSLARHFHKSFIFGINPNYQFCYSIRDGYVGFNPRFNLLLRFIIPIIENYFDISHVYGQPTPWIFFKSLKRKPIIHTISSEKGKPEIDFLERCNKIIVQTETFRKRILGYGIEKKKVELMYPGVDLSTFKPDLYKKKSMDVPKIIFATSPRSKEEMVGRGVNLLLSTAKEDSGIHFHLLYRKWKRGYTSLGPTKHLIDSLGLTNVTLTDAIIQNMPLLYREHHFTIIPYTSSDGGKECPNSLVEGLACGLPVLISSVSPFAYFVDAHKCGVIFDPVPSSLIKAVDIGMRKYDVLSKNAIIASRSYFSADVLIEKTSRIYGEVCR